jgi:hypothetical protein
MPVFCVMNFLKLAREFGVADADCDRWSNGVVSDEASRRPVSQEASHSRLFVAK